MIAKRKGDLREEASERSVEAKARADGQEPDRGIRCRASWHGITKPISTKAPVGKFGGCALKAVRLTSGDLLLVSTRD